MLEDLLFGQEQTNSILIIDNFENEGNVILLSLIAHFLNKDSNTLHIFGTNSHTVNCYLNFYKNTKVKVHDLLCKELFANVSNHQKIDYFSTILNTASLNENEKKSMVFIDNSNLVLATLDTPFKYLQFMNEAHKNPNLSTVVTLLHEDSISEYCLNQVSYAFQTIIHVNKLTVKQQNYNFTVKITHRNSKNGKTSQNEENYVVSNDLTIKSIKKVVQVKAKQEPIENDEDLLKNLTFNLNLKEDELEAKRNLILPYELVNKENKNDIKIKMSKPSDNEAKIFYQPDERDDVDDEDPDDDLNF